VADQFGVRSVPPAVAGGSNDCRLSIADFGLAYREKANRQSAIANRQSQDPPATAGGTDLIPKLTTARYLCEVEKIYPSDKVPD